MGKEVFSDWEDGVWMVVQKRYREVKKKFQKAGMVLIMKGSDMVVIIIKEFIWIRRRVF